MFTYHNLLPDCVGKQNPLSLFQMLDSLQGLDHTDIQGSDYLQMFYGK